MLFQQNAFFFLWNTRQQKDIISAAVLKGVLVMHTPAQTLSLMLTLTLILFVLIEGLPTMGPPWP